MKVDHGWDCPTCHTHLRPRESLSALHLGSIVLLLTRMPNTSFSSTARHRPPSSRLVRLSLAVPLSFPSAAPSDHAVTSSCSFMDDPADDARVPSPSSDVPQTDEVPRRDEPVVPGTKMLRMLELVKEWSKEEGEPKVRPVLSRQRLRGVGCEMEEI